MTCIVKMSFKEPGTWMVKAGETGGFGGSYSSSIRSRDRAPGGQGSSWECRAARSRWARPEEAQEPSWGTAKGAL
eukprot:scaffold47222_cov72-Phaeocystis_antarctica.AAC.2